MEFTEKLNQFAQRVESLKDSIATEEATKTSIIMPFFQMLGYDVFNPLEFVPEFTADVGIKKGEKVDYAIMDGDEPLILIECKSANEILDKHDSQLFRYFGTTAAKFAILTNGIIYKFYTDLEDKNRMDSTPFLEFDILSLKENLIPEIKKFNKDMLDVETILGAASELKYTRLIKEWFVKQLDEPSVELVKIIMKCAYEGQRTQKAIEKFQPLVRKSFKQFMNDTMNERIKSALRKEQHEDNSVPDAAAIEPAEVGDDETSRIVTTMEELEAFTIVKSIIRNICDVNKVFYRDTESYLGVLYEDSNRKWICRIHLNGTNKFITIPDANKKPERYDIDNLNDIYKHADEIICSCNRYL